MPGIYLDHAATTPVRPEVREAMLPYLKEQYGNPSGLYQLAVEAEEAMEAARKTIAARWDVRRKKFILLPEGQNPTTGP